MHFPGMHTAKRILTIVFALILGPALTYSAGQVLPEISDPTVCLASIAMESRFGTVLAGVLILGSGILLILRKKRPPEAPQVVVTIISHAQTLCRENHASTPVGTHALSHHDRSFYDDSRQRLEAMGFTFLQDQGNPTLCRSGKMRVMRRVMLSSDCVVAAALYLHRPRWLRRMLGGRESGVLDLATQLSDGTFLYTSNAPAASALNCPSGVVISFLAVPTPLETMVETHARRLAACLRKHPRRQPVRMHRLEDVHRMQCELQRTAGGLRGQIGLAQDERERIPGTGRRKALPRPHAPVVRPPTGENRAAA